MSLSFVSDKSQNLTTTTAAAAIQQQQKRKRNDKRHTVLLWQLQLLRCCFLYNILFSIEIRSLYPSSDFSFEFFLHFMQEIPIVVAANKLDLASTHREIQIGDVSEWVFCELPKLRSVELANECSR